MSKKEVKIAGAGIAGLTAAINLAKAGVKAVVFERAREVGSRFNDDFQGLENWSTSEDIISILEGMNIETGFFKKAFMEADIVGSEKYRIRSGDGRPGVYMVKRGPGVDTLDRALERQAIKAGVEIVFGKKAGEHEVDIVATGPRFSSGVVAGVTGCAEGADTVMIMLDNECAPKGYVYMALIDGKITLASVVMRDFANAKKYFARAIKKFESIYGISIKDPKPFGGVGNFFLLDSYSKEGRLYAGERAGFQDYLFGFGMRYAFLSGYYAAQSIVSNADYDTAIKASLVPVGKASLVNRFMFEKFGGDYKRIVRGWMKAKDPIAFLKNWYRLDIPKRAVYPFALRWYRNRIAFNAGEIEGRGD